MKSFKIVLYFASIFVAVGIGLWQVGRAEHKNWGTNTCNIKSIKYDNSCGAVDLCGNETFDESILPAEGEQFVRYWILGAEKCVRKDAQGNDVCPSTAKYVTVTDECTKALRPVPVTPPVVVH